MSKSLFCLMQGELDITVRINPSASAELTLNELKMLKKIEPLQYITQDSDKYSHAEQALLMYKNGIKWVQIRMKQYADDEIFKEASLALKYARQYNSVLIINDSVEIAKQINAHGVHLGLKDIPIDKARTFLGNNFIIGGTANTIDDIWLQVSRGADYLGVGPFRYTATKKDLSPVLGLEGNKSLQKQVIDSGIDIPMLAIGGIKISDIEEIKRTGLFGVAISTALLEKYT